jgi:hypothetical protein
MLGPITGGVVQRRYLFSFWAGRTLPWLGSANRAMVVMLPSLHPPIRFSRCPVFRERQPAADFGFLFSPPYSFSGDAMGKKLYVGNLGYSVTDADLLKMFEPHGTVQSAQVIMDRDAGRSKGFGFVEMGSDQEAQAAIAALGGKDMNGRALTVNEARPKTEGGGGRGGSGGGYGGGGGRRY